MAIFTSHAAYALVVRDGEISNALESSDWFDVAAVHCADAEVALSGREARWPRLVATQATDAPVVVREVTAR